MNSKKKSKSNPKEDGAVAAHLQPGQNPEGNPSEISVKNWTAKPKTKGQGHV